MLPGTGWNSNRQLKGEGRGSWPGDEVHEMALERHWADGHMDPHKSVWLEGAAR